MPFQTFNYVYVEDEYAGDAPKDLECLIRIESIDCVLINNSSNDICDGGPYYVFLILNSGKAYPVFIGTIEECKNHLHDLKPVLGNTMPIPITGHDKDQQIRQIIDS